MLTVALSKGYLQKETLKLLQKTGVRIPDGDLSRKLEFTDLDKKFRFLIVRPSDVPVYVEYGAADIGVVGKDVLVEGGYNVAELLDLQFGFCRLVVAGIKGVAKTLYSGMRVATKFTNSASAYFEKLGLDVELIKLYGSVELAPLDGLSDVIVDLVATGTTLRENGLEIFAPIYDTTARLIANRVRVKSNYAKIMALAKRMKKNI